jgi:hypothetical protein
MVGAWRHGGMEAGKRGRPAAPLSEESNIGSDKGGKGIKAPSLDEITRGRNVSQGGVLRGIGSPLAPSPHRHHRIKKQF